MSDVTCPYCKTEQEINHDDGYGYDEDQEYEQSCVRCDKEFTFTTHITYNHKVYCKDEPHELANSDSHPHLWECENCEYYEVRREQALQEAEG